MAISEGGTMTKRLKRSRLSLEALQRKADSNPPRKAQKYEAYAFDEFRRLAMKFGDPTKLTPAKFKLIRKICRNATFASTGDYQRL